MNPDKQLENKIQELEERLLKFEKDYAKHQHDDIDGTKILRKNIELDRDQYIQVGYSAQISQPIQNQGATDEQYGYSIGTGKDDGKKGLNFKSDALQLNFLHQPNNTNLQSFITAFRKPIVINKEGVTISTTSGGNTVTINNYGFTTNELAGAVINIFNSSGTFIESRVIASNTSTVVTITGTWGATTSGGTFYIYSPVFFGSADTIFQRFYTNEGDTGGIRFGIGVTAGAQNQNGLLYMNATGDLYWRNKSGTSTKLN